VQSTSKVEAVTVGDSLGRTTSEVELTSVHERLRNRCLQRRARGRSRLLSEDKLVEPSLCWVEGVADVLEPVYKSFLAVAMTKGGLFQLKHKARGRVAVDLYPPRYYCIKPP
jgi:hypothetical protein